MIGCHNNRAKWFEITSKMDVRVGNESSIQSLSVVGTFSELAGSV